VIQNTISTNPEQRPGRQGEFEALECSVAISVNAVELTAVFGDRTAISGLIFQPSTRSDSSIH
jgi:hypothetical protein